MSKAKLKYEGELKSAREIVSYFDKHTISKGFALYLIENEGKKRILDPFGNNDTRFFDGDMFVIRNYFTNLREIKPKIEIPKTPFWIDSLGRKMRMEQGTNTDFDYDAYFITGDQGNSFNGSEVQMQLNNGTWTICDEPEKETENVQAYEIINQIAEKFGIKAIKEI